jgi:hypothetical protein
VRANAGFRRRCGVSGRSRILGFVAFRDNIPLQNLRNAMHSTLAFSAQQLQVVIMGQRLREAQEVKRVASSGMHLSPSFSLPSARLFRTESTNNALLVARGCPLHSKPVVQHRPGFAPNPAISHAPQYLFHVSLGASEKANCQFSPSSFRVFTEPGRLWIMRARF